MRHKWTKSIAAVVAFLATNAYGWGGCGDRTSGMGHAAGAIDSVRCDLRGGGGSVDRDCSVMFVREGSDSRFRPNISRMDGQGKVTQLSGNWTYRGTLFSIVENGRSDSNGDKIKMEVRSTDGRLVFSTGWMMCDRE